MCAFNQLEFKNVGPRGLLGIKQRKIVNLDDVGNVPPGKIIGKFEEWLKLAADSI